jgi:hypothetical protein
LKLLSTTYTFEEIELSLVRLLVFVLLSGCTFAPDELGPVDIESVEEAGAPASPEAGPAVCVAAGGITKMALPFSRNTNYAPGSQVESADLNDIQDCIIDGSHGSRELPITLNSRIVVSGTWGVGTTGQLTESTNLQVARVPVVLPIGSVITGIRVRGIQASSTNQFNVRLQSVTDLGSIDDVGGNEDSDNGITGTAQDVSVDLSGSPVTVVANDRYFVRIEAMGGGSSTRTITGAFVTYYRP